MWGAASYSFSATLVDNVSPMDPLTNQLIGYTASSTTVVAYGLQFFHIIRCGTVEGISLPRTLLDAVSLALWVLYATRTEDLPLLIATSCELLVSLCVASIVIRHQCKSSISQPVVVKDRALKNYPEVCVIYVQPQYPPASTSPNTESRPSILLGRVESNPQLLDRCDPT
jgi:uncharacterized protein with PQ loop repeat